MGHVHVNRTGLSIRTSLQSWKQVHTYIYCRVVHVPVVILVRMSYSRFTSNCNLDIPMREEVKLTACGHHGKTGDLQAAYRVLVVTHWLVYVPIVITYATTCVWAPVCTNKLHAAISLSMQLNDAKNCVSRIKLKNKTQHRKFIYLAMRVTFNKYELCF